MKKDYYEILGVGKTASAKELKAAYRRLARKFHPDVNKGDKQAEERFKEISEAFAVLSDADKRAKYDRGGHEAFGAGFDPFAGFDVGQADLGIGDLSSLFSMFGLGQQPRGGRRGRSPRGGNLRLELRIPFVQAVTGGTVEIVVPRAGDRERIKVRIPTGVDEGSTLRLTGKGQPSPMGGPPGDAFLTLRIEPHAVFRRDGRDLQRDLPVGLARAALGGEVEVETLDGKATISLPAGTASGQRLRLRGRGVPASAGRRAGDLYVVVQIRPPKKLDDRSREIMEEFQRLNPSP